MFNVPSLRRKSMLPVTSMIFRDFDRAQSASHPMINFEYRKEIGQRLSLRFDSFVPFEKFNPFQQFLQCFETFQQLNVYFINIFKIVSTTTITSVLSDNTGISLLRLRVQTENSQQQQSKSICSRSQFFKF